MKPLTRVVAVCLVLAIAGMSWADMLPRPRPRPYPAPFPYPVPVPVPVPQPPNQLPQPDPLPQQRDLVPDFWAPKDVKLAPMPLVIEIDDKVQQPRLEIPSAAFRFRAALDGDASGERHADTGALRPGHTIVAGLAFSMALCSGGIWLVRRRGHPGVRNLTLLLTVTGAVVLFASVVGAWAASPRPDLGPDAAERVSVEIKAKNDGRIKLVLTKKQLAKLVEQAK
jgi:hypothetical protein